MYPSNAALGTPDFGQMFDRIRVVERISQSGDKPCILFGPSGCGKSVAAAQYATKRRRNSVWVDAGGEFISASQIALAALRVIGQDGVSRAVRRRDDALALVDLVDALIQSLHSGDADSQGLLIVVDDLGVPPNPQAAEDIRILARGLWRAGSRLLATCRAVSEWSGDVLREFALVGPMELALTSDEADGYLECAGLASLASQSNEIRSACGGHPAFFVVMASQATEHGLTTRVARTPSLEAWLRNAVQLQLADEEKRALVAATLLRRGTDSDLFALKVDNSIDLLDRLAAAIPLVGCTRTSDGGRTFRVHQLVDGFLADAGCDDRPGEDSFLAADAVALLSTRRDYPRAAELLARENVPEQAIAWLVEYGNEALADGHYTALARLINGIPVAALMAQPSLLLIWAEVCAETGQVDDAFAKCRAARTLAEHSGDTGVAYRALALCARYAGRANRIEEAEELAREILGSAPGQVSDDVLAEALLCRAQNAATQAEYTLASELLQEAVKLSGNGYACGQVARKARQALSLIPALARGDYLETSRMLAPTIVEGHQYLSDRVMLKGNVAACLCEAGRLSRCEQLLRSALAESQPAGLDVYSGAYLAVLGCAKFGLGQSALGLELIRQGIERSLAGGDEQGADQSRVYLAVALRAMGEPTESLVVAERAFERFAVADSCHFRRLAALEVAASLLALGDSSAASAWAGAVVDEGFDGNKYHAVRAAMILAEVDRKEGQIEDAVGRISDESEYLLSENPNWQVAMYCRAFPGLLGTIALALGPSRVPAHLLRMIPPESAEQVLTETRVFLDPAVWRELGERLVGAAEMVRYLDRDGLPLCHVRLFGGLEVAVGGRVVGERDWRKRKARLLFAMLATKRGRDVPRDQVIEYLWPHLDEERARNNLYVAWSTMKSVLGGASERGLPCPYVESVGGVCRTVRNAVRSDVDEFEESLMAARNSEAKGSVRDALSAYERVANLYRGDLLPGDIYDDWFAGLRDHYRSEFVDAMLRAAQLLVDAGDPGNALIYVRRAMQTDPVREDLYQRALRCQIAAGQRSSAIDTYFQCRGKLSEELGLDPSAETQALYDQILVMENRPVSTPLDPLSD